MARGSGCGCGGSKGLLVGGPGIDLAGSGTTGDRWVPSIKGDAAMCEIVEDCVGGILCAGKGLVYDDAANCLAVKISGKAGNDVRLGADGGLWFGRQGNPVDGVCGRTIETMPAFVRGGMFGAGRNAITNGYDAPDWSTAGAGLDATLMWAAVGCDGSIWVVPGLEPGSSYWEHTQPGRDWADFSGAQIQQFQFGYELAEGQPSDFQVCQPLTLDRWLDIIQGKQIGFLELPSYLSRAQSQLVRDRIKARCMERQVIPVAQSALRLAEVWEDWTAAGFDVGVYVAGTGIPSASDLAGYLPNKRLWVLLPDAASDTVIKDHVASGKQVMIWDGARRYMVDRAKRLGARGALSDDPLYAFDTGPCRMLRDPWCYDAIPAGQVTHRDGAGFYAGNQGYRFTDGASSCGWHSSKGSNATTSGRWAMTPGWALPIPTSWTSYQVDWSQLWDAFAGRSGGTGMIVCSNDDRAPVLADGSGISPDASGYSALMMHATSGLQLRQLPTETGTPLAQTTGTGPIPVNVWHRFRVTVTPTRVTFCQMESSGANPACISTQSISTTDTAYRGRFMHFYRIQRQTATSTPWGRVDVAWRDFTLQKVGG